MAHHLVSSDSEMIDEYIRKQDILLCQLFSSSGFNDLGLTPNRLKERYSTKKIVIFPNIYSNVYHPFVVTGSLARNILNLLSLPFADYLDLINMTTWSLAAPNSFSEITNSAGAISCYLDYAMAGLINREDKCDISASSFIRTNCTETRLFYTPNHPSNHVFKHLCQEFLRIAGLDAQDLSVREKPYLDDTDIPPCRLALELLGITGGFDDITLRGSIVVPSNIQDDELLQDVLSCLDDGLFSFFDSSVQ